MEQMPHHREGVQEQLDKAYDEAHRDNEAVDNQKMQEWKQTLKQKFLKEHKEKYADGKKDGKIVWAAPSDPTCKPAKK